MTTSVSDWVLETTNTTGTGAISLGGALDNHSSFSSSFDSSTNVWYSLETESGDRECGRGYYDKSNNTLVRATVDATLVSGEHKEYPQASPIYLAGLTKVGVTLNAKAMRDIITALETGSLRGVRVYGPQSNQPTDAVVGDFWIVS